MLEAMRKVQVSLGARSYEVLIGKDLLSALGGHCRRLGLADRCVVVTDKIVGGKYGAAAMESLAGAGFEASLYSVPAGESSKSLEWVRAGCDCFAGLRLDRGAFVVALGGGVVGDLAGFLAAVYLRGIDFVQVPTTLLAQVDSSVGGKVGVNLEAGKNLVGAFHQPRLVLCDLGVLESLPDREFRAGMAEVVKYGVIWDEELFSLIEAEYGKVLAREDGLLESIIARSCEIKAGVVAQDERDEGVRAVLNFGHTVGHALEAITGYGEYLHGEAISVGQVAAAMLSARELGLDAGSVERIRNLLSSLGLPISVALSGEQRKKLLEAIRLDKKVSEGAVRFVLAERIGRARWGQAVGEESICAILEALGKG